VRTDSAGATHEFLDYLREGQIGYLCGYDLTDGVRRAILDLPENARATRHVRGGDAIELAAGDSTVRESPFEFEHAGHRLSGVLSEPIGPPSAPICAVLLNTGADRRIGVGRISVEAARRWAAHGIPTLRFDVAGVGDSDGGEGLYAHSADAMQLVELADQVISALDAAEARGLPARFVVGGMCAGAFWGLHAALKDERVRGSCS
jgi:hypothetical protein